MTTSSIKKGQYQHYKGGLYEVMYLAIHSESHEELVVYRALCGTEKYSQDTIWVRPRSMFEEEIEISGVKVARFKYLE